MLSFLNAFLGTIFMQDNARPHTVKKPDHRIHVGYIGQQDKEPSSTIQHCTKEELQMALHEEWMN